MGGFQENVRRVGRAGPTALKVRYRRWLVDEFLTYFYDVGTPWQDVTWLGVPVKQAATDLLAMQQIVVDTRPDLIVETGTFYGGSALFFAHVLDGLGIDGQVLTIDRDMSHVREEVRAHPRVELLEGDTTTEETAATVARRAAGARRVMLHLDANHNMAAVLAELRGLADLVSPGCYIIVADCIMGGHPAPFRSARGIPERYYGPYDAVDAFLAERQDFERDESREYQLVTFHRGGYLRRRDRA